MSSSIGLSANLSLNTGGFTRELDNAKKAYQRTVREMERTRGEGFRDIIRGAGSTGADFRAARMAEVRNTYQRSAVDTSWQNSIRSMSMAQAEMSGLNRQQDSFLNTAVKIEAALQATRLIIGASVAGAKMLTGEFKTFREVASEASKLPIVGGVIGSVVGMYDYAKANDLKAAQAEEIKKAERQRAAYLKQQENARNTFSQIADDAEFEAVTVGLSEGDKRIEEIEKNRKERIAAIRKQVADLRLYGQVSNQVIAEAGRAIRGINSEAEYKTLMEKDKIKFEAEEAAKKAKEEKDRADREARRSALTDRRDALSQQLSAEQEKASAISSQRLGLLTAFANPNVYMTGAQQREQGVKPGLDAIKRELEEVNRQLRDDKSVRVGNN